MNAISIGPLMLATDRASAIAGILAFIIITGLIARRYGSLGGWSTWALTCGIVSARLAHVVLNWATFADEPSRIFAVWQGGFYWPVGIGVAAALLFPLVRGTMPRLACLGAVVGGLFAWQVSAALTSGVEPIQIFQRPLQTLTGSSVRLADFAGQPMVINLWATWCPPCRREMPMMTKIARETDGVTFVFGNQGEDAFRIQSYLAAQALNPPNVLLDSLNALSHHYRTPGLPATLFIGRDGILKHVHMGEISTEEFRSQIDLWLSEPADPG